MIIMDIVRVILGLALALCIPGYLLARIFFKELSELEKLALGFVLSIALDIAVGLFLGYNEAMKNLTGGITAFNLWLYLTIITIILFIMYAIKNHGEFVNMYDYFFFNPRKHNSERRHAEKKLTKQKRADEKNPR